MSPLVKSVQAYMLAIPRSDRESHEAHRERVIHQYVSDHVTGSGKTREELFAEVTEEVGDDL